MHVRENALKDWLLSITQDHKFKLNPIAGDASFRSYYRLEYDGRSHIVMDAPPDKENVDSFINIAKMLNHEGIVCPIILAQNPSQGFLLLSDLGNTLLLDKLNAASIDNYYQQAIHILFKIQNVPIAATLPCFDEQFMVFEMNYCLEWFFNAYLSLNLENSEQLLIKKTFEHIATVVANQPQVFIHRDYHSRNLMILNDDSFAIIDFQDAMCGPLTYDLVSLLKDCYISWPREKQLQWVQYFFTNSAKCQDFSLAQFIRAYDFCGLQRHLKVLGIFCRLFLRDNKKVYLKYLPRTLQYILECVEIYEELHPFYHFLQNRVHLP